MWIKDSKRAATCSLIGAHFVMAPISFLWSSGNLMEYINSYFQCKCYPDCMDGDSQWILNLYLALTGVGLFMVDSVRRRIGINWTYFIAIVISNASYLLSAWTIKWSVIATCIFMGAIMGAASGMIINIGFVYINLWATKNAALFMATVTAIGPLLAVAQNQIITEYVNPKNLKPDAQHGPHVFFSQPEILDRVPEVIIILVSIAFGLQLIGLFLVLSPSRHQSETKTDLQCSDRSAQNATSTTYAKCNGFSAKSEKNAEKNHANHNGYNHYGSNGCIKQNALAKIPNKDSSPQDKEINHIIYNKVLQDNSNGSVKQISHMYHKDDQEKSNATLNPFFQYGSDGTNDPMSPAPAPNQESMTQNESGRNENKIVYSQRSLKESPSVMAKRDVYTLQNDSENDSHIHHDTQNISPTMTHSHDGPSELNNGTDVSLDISQDSKIAANDTENSKPQIRPLKAIKMARFWDLWLYGAATGLGMTLKDSYYKQYGLIYIRNDKLLTLLGSLMPVVVCVSRVAFGGLVKKGLVTVNIALVFSLLLNCLTCAFWFFAPGLDEVLYIFLILVMSFSHSLLYVVLATGTLEEFGTEHFANIYSMVYSGSPIASFLSACYMTPVLDAVGWFWVFMSSSILSFVALSFMMFTHCFLYNMKKRNKI